MGYVTMFIKVKRHKLINYLDVKDIDTWCKSRGCMLFRTGCLPTSSCYVFLIMFFLFSPEHRLNNYCSRYAMDTNVYSTIN